jgi:hypothetical protein
MHYAQQIPFASLATGVSVTSLSALGATSASFTSVAASSGRAAGESEDIGRAAAEGFASSDIVAIMDQMQAGRVNENLR